MLDSFIPAVLGVVEISLFGYFAYVAIYNFLLSVAGHFKTPHLGELSGKRRKYLILIPAYKEDLVIKETVLAALNLDYSISHFRIVVVADSFEEHTLEKLRLLPINVIAFSSQHPTKVKAVQFALENIKETFDAMVMLDADNHIDPNFLSRADRWLDKGYKIIQGRRMMKSSKSDLAYLDGISEEINTHINRRGCFNLGMSASIAGSGFVMDYSLGVSIFNVLDSIGGFDKDFELQAIKRKFKTAFSDDLIVYDEKVETDSAFKGQRRRWISSQYVYLSHNLIFGFKSLFKGSFTAFNTIILRNLQLPRLLNLGLLLIVIALGMLLSNRLLIDGKYWIILLIIFVSSIFISIPRNYYNKRLYVSILRLPKVFCMMLLLMFGLRGANKSFIHTPHGSTSN